MKGADGGGGARAGFEGGKEGYGAWVELEPLLRLAGESDCMLP